MHVNKSPDIDDYKDLFTHHYMDTGNGVDKFEEIRFEHFPGGSILLFEAEMPSNNNLNYYFLYFTGEGMEALEILKELDHDTSLYDYLPNLTFADFEYILYSCENEELLLISF